MKRRSPAQTHHRGRATDPLVPSSGRVSLPDDLEGWKVLVAG